MTKAELQSIINDIGKWYSDKLADPNTKDEAEILGPPTYNAEALMSLKDQVIELEVIHRGLEDIAPDLDQQSRFVLNSMQDGIDNILDDFKTIYSDFISFATKTGPIRNLSQMNKRNAYKKREKLKAEYTELQLRISQHSVAIHTSKTLIQNSISALNMQANIAPKILEHGGKMYSQRKYRNLANLLEHIIKQLQSLQQKMARLNVEMDRAKTDSVEGKYPIVETSGGEEKVDKLYYDVMIAFLQVIEKCLEIQKPAMAVNKALNKLSWDYPHPTPQIERADDRFGKQKEIYSKQMDNQVKMLKSVFNSINREADYINSYIPFKSEHMDNPVQITRRLIGSLKTLF